MADAGFGFGVVAGLPPELLAPLAREIDRLGFGAFWINDSGRPDADGLAGLAVVADASPALTLGVGVLPLDRRTLGDIADEVRRLGLPLARLRLGVGSGGENVRPLRVVRDGVAGLREQLPEACVFISALGPQMARLAGEIADGVLFNWATPDRLAVLNALVAEGEREAGRARIERWTYVRTAIGPDAQVRLAHEAERYAGSPAYGRAFEAMDVPFETIGVAGEEVRSALAVYRPVVDGVVARALPVQWTLDEALAIARAAGPGAGDPISPPV